MKKVLTIFIVVLIWALALSSSYGEVPRLVNYQGVLKDTANVPQAGNFSFTFSIYTQSVGGAQLWTETQNPVNVSQGLFSVLLGSVNPIPYSVFNGEDRWLEVSVGGTTLSPRRRMVSVAYAYKTNWADSAYKAIYADTARFAHRADTANFSYTSHYADSSGKIDGLTPGSIVDTTEDYGRNGVASNLYEATTPLVSKYLGINATAANSDKVDGYHAGNSSGQVPVSNGTLNGNLNADLLDGLHASSTPTSGYLYPLDGSAKIPNARLYTGSGNGLDADLLDGFHASSFTTTASDFGRSGVSSTLYEGTTALNAKYLQLVAQDNLNMNSHSISNASGVSSVNAAGYALYGESNSSGTTAIRGTNLPGNALWVENNSTSYVALYAYNPKSNAIKGENASTSYPTIWGLNSIGPALTAEGSSSSQYIASVINNNSTSSPGLYVRGSFSATGTKSAIISTSQGQEPLFSIESPDVEFYANGSGKLVNGEVSITFERLFKEAISSTIPVKVIVTPVETWSGIYVINVTSTGFTAKSENGDLNADFNWIAIGRRKAFEERPVLSPDFTKAIGKPVRIEEIPTAVSSSGGKIE
jgi:hypothetical protein